MNICPTGGNGALISVVYPTIRGKDRMNGYDLRLPELVIEHFGAEPLPNLGKKMDEVIFVMAHSAFRARSVGEICMLMNDHLVLIDVQGIVDRDEARKAGMH